jgi:hypothetical protein
MPVVLVTVEDVLVNQVALRRVQLPGELLCQPVQRLLHRHPHSGASDLLLTPVKDDLVALQGR